MSTTFLRRGATLAGHGLACLAMLSLAPAVHAAPVTYDFSGVVTKDPLNRGLTTFGGTFTADTEAPMTAELPGFSATFTRTGSPWGMTVTFGGLAPISHTGLKVLVTNNILFGDSVFVTTESGIEKLEFLWAPLVEIWDTTTLLPGLTQMSLLPGGAYFLDWVDSQGQRLNAVVTSLSCVAGCSASPPPPSGVPVPGSAALVLLGLSLVGASTYRAKRP
jgi:hypothetical protein